MVAYTRDIPDAPNNPSVDQPKMKANNNAVDDILQVDHISFNATDGGTHKQNSYVAFSAGAVIGGTAASVAYPAAGIAEATRAQYYFKNSTNTFLLSAVRAFGYVTGATGAIIASQSLNVSGVVRLVAGAYRVTVDPNVLTSADYMIFISGQRTAFRSLTDSYEISSATSFDLFFHSPPTGVLTDPTTFAFVVLQI